MTPASIAAHRLVTSLPLSALPNLVEASAFTTPCQDDAGRDLVFSALLNPGWKAAGNSKAATQQALAQWLQRPDVDAFALQPMPIRGKKTPPGKAYRTSFEIALDLGLESLLQAMLTSTTATPDRLARVRSTEPGASLLQAALRRGLLSLVRQAVAVGWDVHAPDEQGRSLLWHARSSEAVRALLELGIPSALLSTPGLVDGLVKVVPKKDIQDLLAVVHERAPEHPSLGAQKMCELISTMQKYSVYQEDERRAEENFQSLMALRQDFRTLVTTPGNGPSECHLEVTRGVFRGTLNGPALLARASNHDPFNPPVVSLLKGMEDSWFGRPPTYVREGVTDFGLFALFTLGLSQLNNETQNETNPKIRVWREECVETHDTIVRVHGTEQWTQWKIETAVTLAKRPTAEALEAFRQWFHDLVEPCESGIVGASQAKRALDELERAASAGVPFVGENITGALKLVDQWLEATPDNQHDIKRLMVQRDRLLLAFLGAEASLLPKLENLGVFPSQSWKDEEREDNPRTLFVSSSVAELWDNPALNRWVERGIAHALTLNVPQAPVLRQAQLDRRLSTTALVDKPRQRL